MTRYTADHLKWTELTDFSPGHWTNTQLNMPPSAAQRMVNCHPLEAGGFRAAFKPESFPTGSISVASHTVIGVLSRSGVVNPAGNEATDRWIWLHHAGEGRTRVYRWDGENSSSPTDWTLRYAHTAVAGTSPYPVIPTMIRQTSGGLIHVCWPHNRPGHASENGIWSVATFPGGASVARRVALANPYVTATMNTMVFTSDLFTLRWSASGDVTSWPAPNFVEIRGAIQGNAIFGISATMPDSILIGTFFAPWVLAQGNLGQLGAASIRSMGAAAGLNWPQLLQQTPVGVPFIGLRTGVLTTMDGSSFENLSPGIDPAIWTVAGGTVAPRSGGHVAWCGDYLLAPRGLMYHLPTKSWFVQSTLSGAQGGVNNFYSWPDLRNLEFFVAEGGQGFGLWTIDVSGGAGSQRWDTWTWRSAPFRGESGRRLGIREVQVVCRAYGSGNSTVTVTDRAGVSRSETIPGSGVEGVTQTLRFYFPRRSAREINWITVTGTAPNSTTEAPTVEAIRIGLQEINEPA